MRPEVRLEMVHMQLTRACNLNCWFCGQRKSNGKALTGSHDKVMKLQDWMAVIDQLKEYRTRCHTAPTVMIWGGEALLSECFVPVATALYEAGFLMGMVTNGTLIQQHTELCRNAFEKIYISVDGPEVLHDSIRGDGTYQRIKENIKLLRREDRSPELILMTVITKELLNQLPLLAKAYRELAPDAVLLQDMIGLREEEIREYQSLMECRFHQAAPGIEAWEWSGPELEECQVKELNRWVETVDLPFAVSHILHGGQDSFCLSPFRHIHIMWDGEVTFCTDFTDFSAGNVKRERLMDLFGGEAATCFREEVRTGKCVTCRHCSWKGRRDYSLV